MQDMYDRADITKNYKAAILENDYLKATFLPELGGKLWSLIDKETSRELLFSNSVVRPCNLAIRNAWTSGGIEWNLGFRGHSPYTCAPVHTAKAKLKDGTPVLRFYWFERVRGLVAQLDCFLPDNSRQLFVRTRITNPHKYVTPVYWWTNMAVADKPRCRVIVPADEAFSTKGPDIVKLDIPHYRGRDISYPGNNIISKDFFFKTFEKHRHYVAEFDGNGNGFFETSTERLKGRKLFVWGNSQGGSRWQNYLTEDNETGAYNEIQCGLANSQYESLPMPPHTVWEWMEAFGAIKADSSLVHGDYKAARAETEKVIEKLLPENALEDLLKETKAAALTPAEEIIMSGDGWGALERELYNAACANRGLMCEWLDFGVLTEEQAPWKELLENGSVGLRNPSEVPSSYIYDTAFVNRLEAAVNGRDAKNWYAYYQLGVYRLYEGALKEAAALLRKSISLEPSPWANYALAVALLNQGHKMAAEKHLVAAVLMRPDDISLTKELFRIYHLNRSFKKSIEMFESGSGLIRENNRLKLYYAFALAETGRKKEAAEILCGKDGKTYLLVPDIREGEIATAKLWYIINEGAKPMPEPPGALDFRMNAREDELD